MGPEENVSTRDSQACSLPSPLPRHSAISKLHHQEEKLENKWMCDRMVPVNLLYILHWGLPRSICGNEFVQGDCASHSLACWQKCVCDLL